jgi:hypothetical protein
MYLSCTWAVGSTIISDPRIREDIVSDSVFLFFTGTRSIFVSLILDAPGPNMGCIQRGKILLEYFFITKKVLALIEEISASTAPDFIFKAQFFMTDGAVVIGTHTSTRSASLTQLSTFAHNVTCVGGLQSAFVSYARTFVPDFSEKYLENHEPILPPAPIIDTCWTIFVSA